MTKKIKKQKKKRQKKSYKPTISKVEKEFGTWVEKEFKIKLKKQFKIGCKFYDSLIENTNIILELDGDFWHCNPDLFPEGPKYATQKKNTLNDKIKNKLALNKGYSLIRICPLDTSSEIRSSDNILSICRSSVPCTLVPNKENILSCGLIIRSSLTISSHASLVPFNNCVVEGIPVHSLC